MSEITVKENQLPEEQKPEEVRIRINPAMRHFFFGAFKSRREYKELQKQIGKIETVGIIITIKDGTISDSFLRAQAGEENVDTPFTQEEMKKFLKSLGVKDSTLIECKRIFIIIDMLGKKMHIQQTRNDGTKKNITI